MPDFVRITNVDHKPFDFHQSNQKRILPPGGDAIIPWHLAAALFGNPSLLNVPPMNDRQTQYQKVRSLYGFSQGLRTEEDWLDMKPYVVVTDLETSEEITMLMDDPEGKLLHKAPAPPTAANDVMALQQQIASLQAQMQAFISQATGPQEAAAGTTTSPTATTDAPPVVDPADVRNPAFGVVEAPFPGAVNDAGDQFADGDLLEMGIELPDLSPEPSEDGPQTVTTGDQPGRAHEIATRRALAPRS